MNDKVLTTALELANSALELANTEITKLKAERDALKADLEIAKEAQRCECSADQACQFARERDALKAKLAELAKPEPEVTVVAYSDTWFDIIEKYQRPPCSRHPDAPHGFDRTEDWKAGNTHPHDDWLFARAAIAKAIGGTS